MPSIGVIGTGFGGVAIAAELLRNGYRDVRLWERADSLGGVWRDNRYPGAACDVPSPFYSFSFAPWPNWRRRYAEQPDILRYLEAVAAREGVTERTRFGATVTGARWDGAQWEVSFADGARERVDVLVSAVGQLSTPSAPAIAGAETFAGEIFHSAHWPAAFEAEGREIAVIGSAATAVQLVPRLARTSARVTLFQRTPNYIWPKPDGAYPRWYRRWARGERGFFRWLGEQFSRAIEEGSLAASISRAVTRVHLRRQVRDPRLRAALRPDYPIGCKRILFSNDFYPALVRENVDLVTAPIARLRPDGVETADGRFVRADTVVYATGFAAQSFLGGLSIAGSAGVDLHDRWEGGARAMLGMYVPGFPNFAIAYGPNTNLGGSSIILMLEAQARHVRLTLDRMIGSGACTFEATGAGEQRWDDEVQGALARSAWASCENWYQDPVTGRITSNWPGGPAGYLARTRDLEPADFTWG